MSVRVYIIALLTAASLAHGRTGVVLHPLQCDAGEKEVEWMRYAIPDLLFRTMSSFSGLQVWDPAFLFMVDSTGHALEVDSVVQSHWERWQWGTSIGGAYRVASDSVVMQIRLVTMTEGNLERKAFSVTGKSELLPAMFRSIVRRVLNGIGYEVDKESLREIDHIIGRDLRNVKGYATYALGFGREMYAEYEEALTAYGRATTLLSSPGIAHCRMGQIYKRAGRIDHARASFNKALADLPRDPLVVAEAAGFSLDFDLPARAIKFTESKRDLLEQTATGLQVLGKLYLTEGEFQRASAMLTRSIAFGASDLETDFLLGNTYFAIGQFDLASDLFNRLVQLRPDHLRYYISLGAAYRNAGRLMESAQILENAQKLAPDDATVLLNLANTYFGLQWYEKSKQLLKRAKEINPELVAADVNLAAVYWQLGLREQAKRMFRVASRSRVHRQLALNNIGNIQYLSGDYAKALRAYKKADKAGKKNETVLYNIALTHIARDKEEKAIPYLESVLQLSPSRLDALAKVADITRRNGNLKSAEVYYSRILDVEPTYEEALVRLSELLCRQDRCKGAVEYIEAYLERFPSSKKARVLLADTYNEMEWFEVAEMKYREIASDYPNDPDAHLGLARAVHGNVVKRDGKGAEEAIPVLEKAAKMNRHLSEAHYFLGEIYLVAGRHKNAATVLKTALNQPMTGKTRKKFRALLARVEKR